MLLLVQFKVYHSAEKCSVNRGDIAPPLQPHNKRLNDEAGGVSKLCSTDTPLPQMDSWVS